MLGVSPFESGSTAIGFSARSALDTVFLLAGEPQLDTWPMVPMLLAPVTADHASWFGEAVDLLLASSGRSQVIDGELLETLAAARQGLPHPGGDESK